MSSVALVGTGRMGLALAERFAQAGDYDTIVLHGRRPEPPAHPVFERPGVRYVFGLQPLPGNCRAVLLAVPEDALAEVAHALADQGPAPEGCVAFHLSGALPTDVLAPLHSQGYQVGVFHPWVVTGLRVHAVNPFAGAAIGVTASPEASRVARELASEIGAYTVPVPAARRVLADAAVAMLGAYLPALIASAVPVLEEVGLDPDDAVAALVPLARSVVEEVGASGVREALRLGLERRGSDALAVHLRALDGDERDLYGLLDRVARARIRAPEDGAALAGVAHPFDDPSGG